MAGWELYLTRLGVHAKGARKRTYGYYQVFLDGKEIDGLNGHMCEAVGPGDNTAAGRGRRIEAGRYPIWTQFGRYRSIGYSQDVATQGVAPMPGVLLQGTAARTGILIHPAHPPGLFLSSVGCFNPTNQLAPRGEINFWDSRKRTVDLIDSLRRHDPSAFADETSTRIANAWMVVDDGESMELLEERPAVAETTRDASAAMPPSLPISEAAAKQCARWLKKNFGAKLSSAVRGKGYGRSHLAAIVCQETAYKWLKWTETMDAKTIVERCVFDASGDYPNTSRGAFPVSTDAFRDRYGPAFADMLIEEANVTRRLQRYGDKPWVYKGYGLFQYDLQHVGVDEAFFRRRLWYDFDECLSRCCKELDAKLEGARGDLWKAIERYNGSGARARQYAANVKAFTAYCAEEIGD